MLGFQDPEMPLDEVEIRGHLFCSFLSPADISFPLYLAFVPLGVNKFWTRRARGEVKRVRVDFIERDLQEEKCHA